MKRKMLGAASVVVTAVALAMPAGAQAQTADIAQVKMCGPTLQDCVEGWVDFGFDTVADGLQLTMDVVEAVCDWGTGQGCSIPLR